jgi:hypothetical protein
MEDHDVLGQMHFRAPELFELDDDHNPVRGPNRASDVFGFGITAYCILSGIVSPYPAKDPATGVFINPRARVTKGLRPDVEKLRQVVVSLSRTERKREHNACAATDHSTSWSADPNKRPRMRDIVNALQKIFAKEVVQNNLLATNSMNNPVCSEWSSLLLEDGTIDFGARIQRSLAHWRKCNPTTLVANICGRRDLEDSDFAHLQGIKALNLDSCNQSSITDKAFESLKRSVPNFLGGR